MSTRKILFLEKMVKNENITTKVERKSDRTECGSDTKHILYIITDMLIFKTYQKEFHVELLTDIILLINFMRRTDRLILTWRVF